jgi:hypothetical protein
VHHDAFFERVRTRSSRYVHPKTRRRVCLWEPIDIMRLRCPPVAKKPLCKDLARLLSVRQ